MTLFDGLLKKKRIILYLNWFDKKILSLLLTHLNKAKTSLLNVDGIIYNIGNLTSNLNLYKTSELGNLRERVREAGKSTTVMGNDLLGLIEDLSKLKKREFLKIISMIESANPNSLPQLLGKIENYEVPILMGLVGRLESVKKAFEDFNPVFLELLEYLIKNYGWDGWDKSYKSNLENYRIEYNNAVSELNKAVKLLRRGEKILIKSLEKYK